MSIPKATPSTTVALAAAAALLALSACSAPPTAAANTPPEIASVTYTAPILKIIARTNDEARFLAALDGQGIEYQTPGQAIVAAHAVCTLAEAGPASLVGAYRVAAAVAGARPSGAGFFVGASLAAFCPWARP